MVKLENSSSLAGASGADQLSESFNTKRYRNRAQAAIALRAAIAECERNDAVLLMDASLLSMCGGAPDPTFVSLMQEANEWAFFASKAERDAYALASFNCLLPSDSAAFLSYVTRVAA